MGYLTKSRGRKRKFKPPKQISQQRTTNNTNPYEPPLKKQKPNYKRVTNNNENLNANTMQQTPTKRTSFKKPRRCSDESPIEFEQRKQQEDIDTYGTPRTWAVFHTKRSNKKHKNYVDGILRHDGKKLLLFDVDSGRQITTALWRKELQQKIDGNEALYFGSFQIEIDRIIENKEYESGQCFHASISSINTACITPNNRRFKPLTMNHNTKKSFKIPCKVGRNGERLNISEQYNHKKESVKPITDPSKIKNALVLNLKNLKSDYTALDKEGLDLRAVCVASFLSCKLRPHQRDGVRFMYECVMGIKNGINQCGVILADEMGLGKTLQTITLIYTLLNDGAIKKYAIKKCLIVTPSSLVGNWRKEFMKWISVNRRGKCGVIAMDEKQKRKRDNIMDTFVQKNSMKNVLIIGYEMLRSYIDKLCKMKIDLIVCDEGHRLKNSRGNQTIDALNRLNAQKRILLTGTPIQNNLSELYAMCDYVNSMCLNDLNHFKNTYARPIERSRDANCSNNEQRIGDERSKALHEITTCFILRRTSEQILRKYLPPKDEYIVFHALNPLQISLYQSILNNKMVKSIVFEHKVRHALQCLLYMRMCCSSARLAFNRMSASNTLNLKIPNHIKRQIMNHTVDTESMFSEKINILMNLLQKTKTLNDKIVVVSNFTSILDQVQSMLETRNYRYLRLDGSTTTQQRTKLVSSFNGAYKNECFIFLLSAKAGGVGLNLIGANRLVLLDPDWNPAVDEQAMARIWRDGQKKKCFIYRFITIGSVEEKILQRQIMKKEIADTVVDRKGKAKHTYMDRHFTKDQLKEIFTLKSDVEKCETVDIMKQSMKDWRICSNKALMESIIPMDHEKQIRVIFQRSVDPKIDPISTWDIQQDNGNENDNELDDEEAGVHAERYHDSDMDSEDEYTVNEVHYDDDNECKDAESEHSDILVLNKKNRVFEEESDDEEDDELRALQSKQQDIEKEIKNITQQTQGTINDLDLGFEFDDV